MAKPDVKFENLAIVCLGQFNPKIFQPSWFASQGLLRDEEAVTRVMGGDVDLQVVHPQVVRFSIDWLQIEVTQDRFTAVTEQESAEEWVRDLVVGTFELLSHTPTRVFGVNRRWVLTYESRDDFDALGWRVVPPQHWEPLDRPGMAAVSVQGVRRDEFEGYLRVTLDPLLDETWRVLLSVNDHNHFSDADSSKSTSMIRERLTSDFWTASAAQSREIRDWVRGLT